MNRLMILSAVLSAVSLSATATDDGELEAPTKDLGPEGYQLGRLGLTPIDGDLRRCWIGSGGIEVLTDKVTAGYVPAEMFAADAVGSPRFGHVIRAKQTVAVRVGTRQAQDMRGYWTPSDGPDAANLRPGRSIIAHGQDDIPTDIAATESDDIVFTVREDGTWGRPFAADTGANDILSHQVVEAAFLNGKRIWQGNVPLSAFAHNATAVPWLGLALVSGDDVVTLTVRNTHATLSATPCIGFTVVE